MLHTIPIYRALNKPMLFMGGERELMMLAALVSLTLIFVALSVQSAILGIVLWLFAAAVLRMMAKKDPLMSKIFVRQARYKKYYRAVASATA
ncbi:MAG: conjugal transfer protein TrbD [Sulfurovaceae bacterium]|nr:conjugal transfer protein TrbD [Sulfurovaceae bacterium]